MRCVVAEILERTRTCIFRPVCCRLTSLRRLKRAKEKAQQRASAAADSNTAGPRPDTNSVLADGGAWNEEGAGVAVNGAAASSGRTALGAGVDRLVAGDELESAVVLRADHRVRSFDFAPATGSNRSSSRPRRESKENSTRVLVTLHNNSMEVWGIEGAAAVTSAAVASAEKRKRVPEGGGEEEGVGGETEASCSRLAILDLQGHRSDVRAVAVSSDGSMVASASHGLAKAWSSRTRQCVRSVLCGFGLSLAFAPGDRHLLVGTKEGNLQVIDRRN